MDIHEVSLDPNKNTLNIAKATYTEIQKRNCCGWIGLAYYNMFCQTYYFGIHYSLSVSPGMLRLNIVGATWGIGAEM